MPYKDPQKLKEYKHNWQGNILVSTGNTENNKTNY